MIKIRSLAQLKKLRGLLALPVVEFKDLPRLKKLPVQFDDLKKRYRFSGAKDQTRLIYSDQLPAPGAVLFVGLGPDETLSIEELRAAAGKAVRQAMELDFKAVQIVLPELNRSTVTDDDMVTALAEGALLANHQFTRYKAAEHHSLSRINLVGSAAQARSHSSQLGPLVTICKATVQAREWVTTPANHKTPTEFAGQIAAAAKRAGLAVEVWSKSRLAANGFNALLAVSQGSSKSPHLVVLRHRSLKKRRPTAVLVGKGVTFDAGGLNLKPTGFIETMKIDMAGAAAAAATLIAAARLKLDLNVIGVLPIVENMISGRSFRPGDIIKTYAGKTVEIGNTDAEGRLILADALAWANKRFSPDMIIDLATLTGACKIALGNGLAGLFSTDDALAGQLLEAGRQTHERCWRLPLVEDYRELLKSDVADTNNVSSGRSGGAITAALFLSAFVEGTPWAHLDIAGPAYVKKAAPYGPPGGTGFGVRLLCHLLRNLAA